jgi:GNAT superfamily N-acetyltransferase
MGMEHSSEEMAAREERRLALSISEVALESEAIAGGWMCYSRPGCWSNQANALGLSGPVTDEELDRLVDFYRERSANPRVSACPNAHHSLVKGLEARHFGLSEVLTVLARDLPEPSAPMVGPWGSPDRNLEIRQPRPEEVDVFIEISTTGFMEHDRESPGALAEITRRVVEHPRCTPFLALWGGTPVGGGLLETLDDQACLIGTSVLPEYRGRGIQTHLMAHRMEFAAETGAKWISVSSLTGIATERNARRLGFNPIFAHATFIQNAG